MTLATETGLRDVWLSAAEGDVGAIVRARRAWADALKSDKLDGRQALHAMAQPMPNGDTRYDVLGVACEISGLGEWTPDDGGLFYRVNRHWRLQGAIAERRRGYVELPTRAEIAHGRLPDAVRLAVGVRTSTGECRLTSRWLAEIAIARPALAAALKVIIPASYDGDVWGAVMGMADVGGDDDTYIGTSLAILNDMGVSLPCLADVIEMAPPGLFV